MNKKQPKQLTALQHLEKDFHAAKLQKYATVPADLVPYSKFKDRTTNATTKCILTKLHLDGWQAERVNRIARPIDNRTEVKDVLGRTRIIGSVQFIKSGGTNGTADISATIAGRSVKVEIKTGKDKMSKDQHQYQKDIEAAGGIYIIATSYENFLEQYQLIKN